MLTNKNLLLERPHPGSIGGTQRIYQYKDGHGLSLINSQMAHCFSFAWEAIVILNISKKAETFELVYDTELTDDIEVFQSDEETNLFIEKAEKLFNK